MALLLCGLLVFVPNVRSYFLSDDFVLLGWTHGRPVGAIGEFFDPRTFWFYRPGVKLFYWLVQSTFGLNPVPFHLASILLHGANAFLLYRLVLGLPGGGRIMGLAASVLFLLNAHNAETVSWSAAIGDLIGASCILSALLLFQSYCIEARPGYLLASLAAFAVGLFTRETVAVLPLLLVLGALLFRWGAIGMRRLLAALAPYGIVLALYLAVQVVGRAGDGETLGRGGLAFRMLNPDSVLLGVLEYVHGLVPGGGFIQGLSLETLRWLLWIEWLAILLLGVGLWLGGRRVMLFGLCWMVVTPLLFVFFSSPTDRYFYLPSIGYAILAAGLITDFGFWILDFGLNKRRRAGFAPADTKAGQRTRRLDTEPNPKSKIRVPSGRPKLIVVCLLAAALVLPQAAALASRQDDWLRVGRAVGAFFDDVRRTEPAPPDYAAFFFVDLPAQVDGVPAFGNSLPQAVQLMYGNPTVAASSVTCEYLRGQAELPRYTYIFRYVGGRAELIGSLDDCL